MLYIVRYNVIIYRADPLGAFLRELRAEEE